MRIDLTIWARWDGGMSLDWNIGTDYFAVLNFFPLSNLFLLSDVE